MAALTAEEIQYTPVMNGDPATDSKPGTLDRLQLVLCIVLAINVFIQFIAFVTPGWSIYTTDSVSAYESVYYATACLKYVDENDEATTECKTKSFHDTFREDYEMARDERKPVLAQAYYTVVQYQLNVQVAWLLVVATLVFQVIKLIRRSESFPKLTTINVIALTCACSLMYQVLFKYFVQLDYTRRISEFVTGDVGFPYSFFFYIFTFIMTLACLILITKQLVDLVRDKDRIYAETKVKFDRLHLEYEAEVEAFRRFRRNQHLRPESGGSYRGDRRSTGDERGSRSPRHSREIRDNDKDYSEDDKTNSARRRPDHLPRPRDHSPRPRDHSPRPRDHSPRTRDHSPTTRDHSPPRGHNNRGHSPRHSPRPSRDRSPPRGYNHRDYSPRSRNRSSPRDDREPHTSRHYSPPRNDRENPHSRDRSPPGQDRDIHTSRHHSPTRQGREKSTEQNISSLHEDRGQHSGEHDNPALVITPPVEVNPTSAPEFDKPLPVDENKCLGQDGQNAETDDIVLNI